MANFFSEHYQQQNKLREVESCLMHLDVTNLDIHQVCNKKQFAFVTCCVYSRNCM